MPHGLWVLLRLRLTGWLRRMGRGLRTVRGALLVVVGVLVIAGWLVPSLFRGPGTPAELENVRRFGPWVLLVFCLLNLLFSSNERALTFSPAEVNFLFSAPVSRRQLLLYRIIGNLGAGSLTAVFMMMVLRRHTALLLGGFLGALLIFTFMQFFSMALALVGNIVGAKAFNRRRRLLIVILAALIGFTIYRETQNAAIADLGELFESVEQSPLVQTMMTPVRWFIDVMTAERVWPDLLQYAGLALAVNGFLLLVIFLLDAQFLEASAAASERIHMLLQRMRRGGPAAVTASRTGKSRLRFPALPFMGGAGPIAWRQLTTALRCLRQLGYILMLCGLVIAPVMVQFARTANPQLLLALTPGLMVVFTIFAPSMIPFDFRSDIDRMDVLKCLPIASWRLVVGQLITPVLVVTIIQAFAAAMIQVVVGEFSVVLTASAAFCLPLNILFIAIDNVMFLWFPTRNITAAPGDVQMMGRMIVLWTAKMAAFMTALIPAAVAAALAYFLFGANWLAAGVAAWTVVMVLSACMIPLAAWAFRSFDVARDTAGI